MYLLGIKLDKRQVTPSDTNYFRFTHGLYKILNEDFQFYRITSRAIDGSSMYDRVQVPRFMVDSINIYDNRLINEKRCDYLSLIAWIKCPELETKQLLFDWKLKMIEAAKEEIKLRNSSLQNMYNHLKALNKRHGRER